MSNVTIATATVPEGTCPPWIIELWPELVALLTASLDGTLNTFNYGNSVPDPADQDKPWLRTNSDGSPDKRYDFWNGQWVSLHPDVPGKIVMWEGDITTIDTFDGGAAGVVGPAAGPMWERVTELDAKFPIGVGTLPGGTVLAVGSTGGEENHTLTTAEIPAHSHTVLADLADVGSGSSSQRMNPDLTTTDPVTNTGETGGGQAHNTMPPYSALYFIRRTARLYYSI